MAAANKSIALTNHESLLPADDALLKRAAAVPPGDRTAADLEAVWTRAAQESDIPNFKGSDLGHFPLVSANSWTSDHRSERSRSVDAFSGTRARGTLTLERR